MLRNYLTIAFRSLSRHKVYSSLNITGLAIGMASCLLIVLYVLDELSFDTFHGKGDLIYRVVTNTRQPGSSFVGKNDANGWPVGRTLATEYPEAEAVVYMRSWPGYSIKHEGQYYFEKILHADENFFRVFSFPLIQGDLKTALASPNSLVLTDDIASKYFRDGKALGKILQVNDSLRFTVTGVVKTPRHSHLQFDVLVSFATFRSNNPQFDTDEGWFDLNMYNYVLLKEGTDAKAFEAKASGLPMRHAGNFFKQMGFELTIGLQPLRDVYLHSSGRGNGLGPTSDIRSIYLLSTIAFFILVIGCINFVNLATARSVARAKEVGVRKVVGSSRGSLVRQFLTESFLTCLLALGLALILFTGILPFFNTLAGKEFVFSDLLAPRLVLIIITLVVLVSFLSGLYPALVLARFKPTQVLKGAYASSHGGIRLRQALVVFQFAVSCVLIVGTIVVLGQLRYMQQQNLGFTKEQVLVLDVRKTPWAIHTGQYEAIKHELLAHSSVKQLSAVQAVPGKNGWRGQITFPEGRPKDQGMEVEYLGIDHDFIRTFGLQIVAGRDLSVDFTTDKANALLINETAVQAMGWGTPANAIGKRIDSPSGYPAGVVVGVVKDYHQHSLRESIRPLVMDINADAFQLYALRINPKDLSSTLAHVRKTWDRFFTGYPFEYFFLDEDFAKQYEKEERLSRIFVTFSGLAIFIACLGLFGLAAFTTVQRTKEIGIRKVLGASVSSIVALLSKDFLKLVLIAFLIAAPIAWWAMNKWLEDFAYRIDIGWSVFAIAGSLALLIALLAVSFQAIKAAVANPVKSLRTE